MYAYSEDLRKKIVEAVERRAMKESEVARLFGVSFSSVKRYVRKFRQGRPLSPGKAPGKRPKVDERARRLLEADLKERPFAKLYQRCEYLEALAGLRVSRSTLCRALKRMGFTRKKGQWVPASETNG
jgi:transposase